MKDSLFSDWWTQTHRFRQRPGPAVLLLGPKVLGIDRFAHRFAASALCHQPIDNGLACGQCVSCSWMNQDQHPDVRWVRPDSEQEATQEDTEELASDKKPSRTIRIEQIRDLLGFTQLTSHRGGTRWALIGPIETLPYASANALLKGLEEPASLMRFVLYGSSLWAVPATLLSRCRRITLKTDPDQLGASRLVALKTVSTWLLPLLQQGRVEPSRWSTIAGKQSAEETLLFLQLWLVDLQRACHALPALTFAAQQSDLDVQAQRLKVNTQALQRISASLARLQSLSRWTAHPLNPQLFFEAIFEDLRQAYG